MSPEQAEDLERHLRAEVERLRAIPKRTVAEEAGYQIAYRDWARFCERHGMEMSR